MQQPPIDNDSTRCLVPIEKRYQINGVAQTFPDEQSALEFLRDMVKSRRVQC